jgi:transcriptional regulator with XRE-family HTH domain
VGFPEERRMAEEALNAGDSEGAAEAPYPPVARRIREAREALGLSMEDVAERWGMQVSMYWDLEDFDHEAFDVLSIDELCRLAAVLQVPVMTLLFGEEPVPPLEPTGFDEIAEGLRSKMRTDAVTLEELAERVGWELQSFLDDPNTMRELPIFGLRWICREVGADWVSVLEGLPDGHP